MRISRSILIFGIYIVIVGILMLSIPGFFTSFLSLDKSASLVVRILGMLLVFYGYFYINSSRYPDKMLNFYKWTIHTRSSAIVFLTVFYLLGWCSPIIISFGVIELAGAMWTLFELKRAGKLTRRPQ